MALAAAFKLLDFGYPDVTPDERPLNDSYFRILQSFYRPVAAYDPELSFLPR